MKRTGIGGHQSAKMENDEWLTPPEILDRTGPFNLDPCAPIVRPWAMADRHFTKEDDGLSKSWKGSIWLNPPYGLQATNWLQRLAQHGDGIALLFARTETEMFFNWVWPYATGLLFLKGRLYFHYVDGTRAKANGGAPSVLIAYGQRAFQRLDNCGIPGKLVALQPAPATTTQP